MTDTTPVIYRRVILEAGATYAGLVDALVGAPREIPGSAEVVEIEVAADYERLMATGPDEDVSQIDERVYVTLEWEEGDE